MDRKGEAMIRLAITVEVANVLRELLLSGSHEENGTFCLVRQGCGHRGTRLLVTKALEVPPDAWEYQEDAMLRPSARFISGSPKCLAG